MPTRPGVEHDLHGSVCFTFIRYAVQRHYTLSNIAQYQCCVARNAFYFNIVFFFRFELYLRICHSYTHAYT